jgi:hypothetical protein
MLEGLEQINWKELRHAYGSAEDVPAQIRALALNDKQIREAALTELWGNIIHQGTVYSATAYAIPFLIELLESPDVKAKPQLLVLVGALACGISYHEAHQPLFEDAGVFTEEMQQPEWQHRIREERGWVEAAWRAVVAGTPTYLILLVDPLPEIRFCATYPLAVCGEHATEILPHLQRRLNEETDVQVQGSLLLCLSCIAGDNGIPLFEEYLAYSKHPLLRALAALCWVRIAKQNAPQLAIDVLTEVLTDPHPIDSLYMQLPWADDQSVVAAASQALGQLGSQATEFVIPRVLDALDGLQKQDSASISMVSLILDLCFEPRKQYRSAELSDFQRSVLRRLARSQRAWDWGNVMLIFRQFGLPDDQKKLTRFL